MIMLDAFGWWLIRQSFLFAMYEASAVEFLLQFDILLPCFCVSIRLWSLSRSYHMFSLINLLSSHVTSSETLWSGRKHYDQVYLFLVASELCLCQYGSGKVFLLMSMHYAFSYCIMLGLCVLLMCSVQTVLHLFHPNFKCFLEEKKAIQISQLPIALPVSKLCSSESCSKNRSSLHWRYQFCLWKELVLYSYPLQIVWDFYWALESSEIKLTWPWAGHCIHRDYANCDMSPISSNKNTKQILSPMASLTEYRKKQTWTLV